jgi:glutamate synthase (NADPH/NADH) small chain
MEPKKLTPRQRMQIPRQTMPEQKPEIRRRNFDEVPLGYDEETAVTEADRCIKCKVPHCIDGCPVNIDIPAFIELVTRGEFAEAAQKIKETNVLPAICGRAKRCACWARNISRWPSGGWNGLSPTMNDTMGWLSIR